MICLSLPSALRLTPYAERYFLYFYLLPFSFYLYSAFLFPLLSPVAFFFPSSYTGRMDKQAGSFFWGVLLGAATVAIAGGVIVARSFRNYSVGIDSWDDLPQGKAKPVAHRAKAVRKRKPAARK